jgi:serine/threonine-protein kinase RIM15
MRWQRPVAEEPALIQLIADTEEQTRFKLNSVNRLRNTILYAEKVRQEWEVKAASLFSPIQEDPSPFTSPLLQPVPITQLSIEPLDLVFSAPQALRNRSSHLFDAFTPPLSPSLSASEGVPRSSSSLTNLPLSPRLPSGVPSSRTKTSSIKDFKMLKPISKGACKSLPMLKRYRDLITFLLTKTSWIRLFSQEDYHWRLLRYQGVEEIGHDRQESSHQRESRTNDIDDPK